MTRLVLFSFLLCVCHVANAADFYQVGSGNHNDPLIWSSTSGGAGGAGVPGAGDVAHLEGGWALTVAANWSVAGLNTSSTAGALNLGNFSLTIGSSHFNQSGGTFNGGTGLLACNGNFTLTGGSYTAPATQTIKGQVLIQAPASFSHANGLTIFAVNYNAVQSIEAGGAQFNAVTINGHGYLSQQYIVGDLLAEGDLTLGVTNYSANRLYGGRILAKKNVLMGSPNFGTGDTPGTCTIVFSGAADQTLDGSLQGHFPNLEVNKPSGKVYLQGAPQVYGSWNWVAAQDLVPGVSTLTLATPYGTTQTFTPGAVTYGSLTIKGWGQTSVWNVAADVSVGGTLTFDMVAYSGNVVNGASFTCHGDVVMDDAGFGSASWGPGTSSIKLVGPNNHAVISNSSGHFPNFTVDTDGTVSIQGDLYVSGNWTFVKGIWVQTAGSRLIFQVPYGKAQTITPNGVTYQDVAIRGHGLSTQTIEGLTLNVNGKLELSTVNYDGAKLNGGTVQVSGNFDILGNGFGATDGGPGSATIKLVGSSQTVTSTGTARCPNFEIASTGSVTLSGNIHFGQNFVYTSGTINTNGSTATFKGRTSTAISGDAVFGNLVIQKGPYGLPFVVAIENAVTVENNLSINEGTLALAADASLDVNGNVTVAATNTSITAGAGSLLELSGTGIQEVALAGKTVYDLKVSNTSAEVSFLDGFSVQAGGTTTASSGAALKFASSQTFTLGKLDWVASTSISARSSTAGQAFNLVADAYQPVRKVAFRDCNASQGWEVTDVNGVDEGGNTNIKFDSAATLAIATPASSAISPAFVEGASGSDVTSVTVKINGGASVDAKRLNPNKWIANLSTAAIGVDLSPTAATQVQVTASNDFGDSNVATQHVTWSTTNLVGKSATNDVLKIRPGDSVLFVADAGYEVDPEGDGIYQYVSTAAGQTFPHTYSQAGAFTARIRTGGVEQGSLAVKAIGVDFQGPVASAVNYQRVKDVTVTPASSNVDVTFTHGDSSQLTATLNQNTAFGAKLNIKPLKRGTPEVLARVGGANGPIVKWQEVDEFTVEIKARQEGIILEHGENHGTTPIIMKPFVPGIKYTFDMFGSTSTFEGGATHLEVFSDTFVQSTDPGTGETIGTYGLFVDMNTDDHACFTCVEDQGPNRVGAEPAVNPCGWECIRPCSLENVVCGLWSINGIMPNHPHFPRHPCVGDEVVLFVDYTMLPKIYRNRCTGQEVQEHCLPPNINWVSLNNLTVFATPTNQQIVWLKCLAIGREELKVTLSPPVAEDCGYQEKSATCVFDIIPCDGGDEDPSPPARFALIPFGGLSSKYRGVDIHGVPRPEASPTGEGESDRIPNMAYVDMYNLAPNYSVTDMALPAEGGEMTIEFRRTCGIRSRRTSTDAEVQMRTLVYANDNLLGLGWDSNIGSRITVADDEHGILGQQTATVVDEVGNTFIYRTGPNGNWVPKVANSFASEAVHNTLAAAGNNLVLKRTFGTTLTYSFQGQYQSANAQTEEFAYRLETVEDRHGNKIQYVYMDNADADQKLLPIEIYEVNHPERRLRIEYVNLGLEATTGDRGWRISKIVDPLGRETAYTYFPAGAPDNHGRMLQKVEQPAVEDPANTGGPLVRPTVQFTYEVQDLNEQNLNGIFSPEDPTPWRHRHVAPKTITDARGHVTTFSYVSENFPYQISFDGLYTIYQPRLRLESAQTVDGTMYTTTISRTPLDVVTEATDTRGVKTNYHFESTAHALSEQDGGIEVVGNGGVHVFGTYKVVLIYAKKLARTSKANNAIVPGIDADKSAIFEWADDPNLNLIKTTDLSGNVIAWEYDSNDPGDAYNAPVNGGAYDAIINPRFYQSFSQPARRIVDPAGLNLVTEYRYEPVRNKLKRQIDAEGKVTDHTFDGFGNRTVMIEGRVATPLPDGVNGEFTVANGPVTRQTTYEYETQTSNPVAYQSKWGFITKTIDPDKRVTVFDKQFPSYGGRDLIANPLDPNVPADLALLLAHCTQTSTLQGYDRNADDVGDDLDGDGISNEPASGGLWHDTFIKTKSVSDIMGNARASVQPRGLVSGAVEADFTTTSNFDNLDREISRTGPKVEDPSNPGGPLVTSTVETHYDLNSNVVTTKDGNGNISHTYYDLMNRARFSRRCMTADTLRREPAPGVLDLANTPSADIVSETRYNEVGLVRQSVEPNGVATAGVADDFVTDFAYDELLRLTLKTLPPVEVPPPATSAGPGAGPASVQRFTEQYAYGPNSGSGAFTILSGWNPTRVTNRRGFHTDTTFDNIYRVTQTVRRLDAGTAYGAAVQAGEPATQTEYNKVHKPIKTRVFNENFAGGAENQESYTYYDDLYRVTATLFDFDGDGPGLAAGSFVQDGSVPVAGADPDDYVSRMVYDKAGNVVLAFDAEGRKAESKYDGAGRVFETLAEETPFFDPLGYNTGATVRPAAQTFYDLNSNKIVSEGPNHTRVKTIYDRRNRALRTIVDLNHDGVFAGDSSGDDAVRAAGDPRFPDSTSADTVSDTFYDLAGNMLKSVDPRGLRTEPAYDKAYRTITVTGEEVADAEDGNALKRPSTSTVYDHNSKVLEVTDPRGVQTKTVYDGLNRARTVTAAFGTPEAVSTESQYDKNNNVLALLLHNRIDTDNDGVLDTDDPQATVYEFDALDRQVKQTLPAVSDGLPRETVTAYYRTGSIRTVTDPKSQTTESEYDRLNRASVTRFKRADATVEETRTFAYNRVSKPLTVTDKNGSTDYVYDPLYRVTSETRATAGQATYSVASAYDAAGNRTRCVYPGTSRTLTSEYDRLNRLSKVTDSVGGKQTAYTYDANGNRRSCALPNGVTDTFTFDKLNRVATHQTNGGSIYNLSYAYDLVGNRRAITETVTGQATRNLAYAYDAQYRLTSESWTGNSYTYSFDLAGNRLKLVQVAGANTFTTTYAYDRLNRLLSASKDGVATSYTYDLNGSRIQKQVAGGDTTAYAFDTLDRLAAASVNGTPVFAASYDYRTRRLTKTEGGTGTYFRYDGGDSFHEVASGTTTIQVEFIRGSGMGGGIGSILYSDRVLSGGSDEYFTYNAVGHTVALTNGLGVATKTDLYEAYGGIVSSTGFSLNNRLANTKERDASIGLDNHGFRYFDPEVGRYISADPIGHDSGWNWYAYGRCNPINVIDPLGLDDDDETFSWSAFGGVWEGAYEAFYGFGKTVYNLTGYVAHKTVERVTGTQVYREQSDNMEKTAAEIRNFAERPIENTGKALEQSAREFNDAIDRRDLGAAGRQIGKTTVNAAIAVESLGNVIKTPPVTAAPSFASAVTSGGTVVVIRGFTYIISPNGILTLAQSTTATTLAVSGGSSGGTVGGSQENTESVDKAEQAKKDAKRDMTDEDRVLDPQDAEFYGGEGVIYKVPGKGTPSGKPYIGSADDLATRSKTAKDLRDRSQATVVDRYQRGNTVDRRSKEQAAIDAEGGIKNLDNARNEVGGSN